MLVYLVCVLVVGLDAGVGLCAVGRIGFVVTAKECQCVDDGCELDCGSDGSDSRGESWC